MKCLWLIQQVVKLCYGIPVWCNLSTQEVGAGGLEVNNLT